MLKLQARSGAAAPVDIYKDILGSLVWDAKAHCGPRSNASAAGRAQTTSPQSPDVITAAKVQFNSCDVG